MTAHLTLDSLTKKIGSKTILENISFPLAEGEAGVLLGASGSGKSTLLRCIAGLEKIDAGKIYLRGRLVSAPRTQIPPEDRKIGIVFQDYSLFPHWSVADNLRFPIRKLGRPERNALVEKWLDIVQLSPLADRYPHQLSGGEQQRVALARALIGSPDLLLLDEPFSSLDYQLRPRLAREVRKLAKEQGTTVLLVTHDQSEAFTFGDRVGVLHESSLVQWSSPTELYHRPTSEFLAQFIGEGALLEGVLIHHEGIGTGVQTEMGFLPLACPAGFKIGQRVKVLLRPTDLVYQNASGMKCQVVDKDFRGANFYYTLKLASGASILMQSPGHQNHAVGDFIGVELHCQQPLVLPLD